MQTIIVAQALQSAELLQLSAPQAEDPFEQFAEKLQSPATLAAATALLQRVALKLGATRKAGGVESLLKRLFPRARNPDRYPARVFLCAYMILKHPKVRFPSQPCCMSVRGDVSEPTQESVSIRCFQKSITQVQLFPGYC